jgi:hypothetical protein
VYCRRFNNIANLYPRDAGNNLLANLDNQKISPGITKHLLEGRRNHPWLSSTILENAFRGMLKRGMVLPRN